jgi:hypothetical protein
MHMYELYSQLGVALAALDVHADVYVAALRTSSAAKTVRMRFVSAGGALSQRTTLQLTTSNAAAADSVPLARLALHAFGECTWPTYWRAQSHADGTAPLAPALQRLSPLMWLRRIGLYAPASLLPWAASADEERRAAQDPLAHWFDNHDAASLGAEALAAHYARVIDECAHRAQSAESPTLSSVLVTDNSGGYDADEPRNPLFINDSARSERPLYDWTLFASGELSSVRMLQARIGSRLAKHTRCRHCGSALADEHIARVQHGLDTLSCCRQQSTAVADETTLLLLA